MQVDLTQIILAVIALLGAVITGFVIPWLKSKIAVENGRVSAIMSDMLRLAVNTAVKAAEQLYTSAEGKEKKAYVLKVLEAQGYEINIEEIDAAIEAAVLELHKQLE